jgi:NADPH-dependent curcumin reductase CurA
MGYMEVGEVVESHRSDLPVGTLVVSAYGHRSCHVLTKEAVAVPVPEGRSP